MHGPACICWANLTAFLPQLRAWMAARGRPLLWADTIGGPMLLDPLVAAQLAGFSHRARATAADRRLFAAAWAEGVPPLAPAGSNASQSSFGRLAARAAPHLHFRWQSWPARAACGALEANASNTIVGVDGGGRCVYWSPAPTPPPRWECLNDGTCSPGR